VFDLPAGRRVVWTAVSGDRLEPTLSRLVGGLRLSKLGGLSIWVLVHGCRTHQGAALTRNVCGDGVPDMINDRRKIVVQHLRYSVAEVVSRSCGLKAQVRGVEQLWSRLGLLSPD
jgi:hypothetical protein